MLRLKILVPLFAEPAREGGTADGRRASDRSEGICGDVEDGVEGWIAGNVDDVGGRSKPATHGHLKTSHFDGGFSLLGCFQKGAFRHGERSQNGRTRSDKSLFEAGLVQAEDRADTGGRPGDCGAVTTVGGVKTSHSAHRG